MAENLKTTHYNNGDEIPTGYSNSDWIELEIGAYSVYPADSSTTCGDNCADVYGNLYNWYALDDFRGICPDAWHIPSDEEWTILTDYLGGNDTAGHKMRECTAGSCPESDYWNSPSDETTNESGFTALPGGARDPRYGKDFYGIGNYSYFWSSSEGSSTSAWARKITDVIIQGDQSKQYGYSIRCLKD